MTTTDFPARRSELRAGYRDLHGAIPDHMKAFGDLHRTAVADGELPGAVKELMAVAIGIVMRCEDCITLLMGGGPASTYATRAIDALEQFTG